MKGSNVPQQLSDEDRKGNSNGDRGVEAAQLPQRGCAPSRCHLAEKLRCLQLVEARWLAQVHAHPGDEHARCYWGRMAGKLRRRQHESVSKVLALEREGGSEEYKLLVLDRYALDLLAPLMRTDELRQKGVTLHMLIDSPRERIPDVPAVYLLRPTERNVDAISNDLSSGLYDSCFINFTSPASESTLQRLASSAAPSLSSSVEAVHDRFNEFVTLEPSLFSLEDPNLYSRLNDPSASDSTIENAISLLSHRLLCVCLTLGSAPLIRCPKGGPAEMVASQLSSLLRDYRHLLPPPNVSSSPRPLLCLFDRNFELAPVVQHAWSYQALAKDLLNMRLNKVNFTVESSASSQKENSTPGSKSHELDIDRDPFWREYARAEFHDAAESVDAELKKYKQEAESVTNLATSQQHQQHQQQEQHKGPGHNHQRTSSGERAHNNAAANTPTSSAGGGGNSQGLASAVNSLPKLQERKAVIDKHTNMATAMLETIKSRGLDAYNRVEESLLEGRSDKNAMLELLNGNQGTAHDKLRLALVYALSCESPPTTQQLEPLEKALSAAGANTAALAYVRKLRSLDASLKASNSKSKDSISATLGSQSSNLFDWADRLYGQGMSAVTRGVSTLLQSGSRQFALTRSVELLMENKPNTEADEFAVFDPRSQVEQQQQQQQQFKDAIVFIIGGGCYLEHHSLQEMARKSQPGSPKRVVYGSTALLSGEAFVDELTALGEKS